jgi:hypothetical protein
MHRLQAKDMVPQIGKGEMVQLAMFNQRKT